MLVEANCESPNISNNYIIVIKLHKKKKHDAYF